MVSTYINSICKSFIFEGLNVKEVEILISQRVCFLEFEEGQDIPQREKTLSIIVSGRASVNNIEIGTRLNTLFEGDCFGFATLFNDCPSPKTKIIAEVECILMFICEDYLEEIMRESMVITKNYIKYISKKVCFLNEKISEFVKYGAKERLKEYIGKTMKTMGSSDNILLSISIKELSNTLNVGRASLYRAFSELEAQGAIKKSAKTIKILNIKYFENEV